MKTNYGVLDTGTQARTIRQLELTTLRLFGGGRDRLRAVGMLPAAAGITKCRSHKHGLPPE